MASRQVTATGKDDQGDITKLCGEDWGNVSKAQAISEIQSNAHVYYTQQGAARANVIVVEMAGGVKHLRTEPDKGAPNLDNLRDC